MVASYVLRKVETFGEPVEDEHCDATEPPVGAVTVDVHHWQFLASFIALG